MPIQAQYLGCCTPRAIARKVLELAADLSIAAKFLRAIAQKVLESEFPMYSDRLQELLVTHSFDLIGL